MLAGAFVITTLLYLNRTPTSIEEPVRQRVTVDVAEVVKHRRWRDLVAIPATFCIGVSCGLPLYLFLRSQPLGQSDVQAQPD